MESLSITEENYLKAIYTAMGADDEPVSTTVISKSMDIAPASVSDMLKKLKEKKLIDYQKYYGASLTQAGKSLANQLVRRHRLWEVFLVEKLNYRWDEVHDVAEQLEHIRSHDLVDRLDAFLHYPKLDPHGESIPDREGNVAPRETADLGTLAVGQKALLVEVTDDSALYLQTLDALSIKLHSTLECLERLEYDGSLRVLVDGKHTHTLSEKITRNLYITPL